MIIRGVPGNKKVFQHIRNIPVAIRSGISQANYLIGRSIAKEAKRTIREDPKTGRIYVLRDLFTNQIVTHRASALGESPALFSGSLATSIDYLAQGDQLVIGAGTVSGDIQIIRKPSLSARKGFPGQIVFGRIVDYAKKLELGGRPYLITSIKKQQKITENYYYQEISRNLLKA